MKYAPILITTLCRYSKFKQCLESLSANPWAKYTTVYIALDYPFKQEHWDGYKKIIEFLSGKFDFEKIIIIKREKNFGPYKNFTDALNEIFSEYDRIIISEDDNVFSPNFLEYMNKCLDRYEFDMEVSFVCGYMYPEKIYFNKNTVFKNSSFFVAWGCALWRDKYVIIEKMLCDENFYKNLLSWNRMIPLLLKKPKIFRWIMQLNSSECWVNDCTMSIYLSVQNKFAVYPVISKVRNIGSDIEGVGMKDCFKYYEHLNNQYIDTEYSFELLEDESFSKINDRLFNKMGKYSYIDMKRLPIFKQFVRFFLYKIFGRKLRKGIGGYNLYLHGSPENYFKH